MLKKTRKHYIPSESELRKLYLTIFPEIFAELTGSGFKEKQTSEIMVEAMTRVIKGMNIHTDENVFDFRKNIKEQVKLVQHEILGTQFLNTPIKDQAILYDFLDTNSPIESDILTQSYFNHHSDKETMKQLNWTEIRKVQETKIRAINKLLGLLNASPQLKSKLKELV